MTTASPPTASSSRPAEPTAPGAAPGTPAAPAWRHLGGHDDQRHPAGPMPEMPFLPQAALGVVGAVMMPLGLLVVALGCYAAARLSTEVAQWAAVAGAGFGGLALSIVGGFLYIGTWFSHLVDQHRAADRRLAETLLLLAEVSARVAASDTQVGALHVTADGGATLHRRDCALIAQRHDLSPADPDDPNLLACRVCRP